jgi:hypothetical protein
VHGAGLENEHHPLIVAAAEVEVIRLEVTPSCCLMREVVPSRCLCQRKRENGGCRLKIRTRERTVLKIFVL